MQVNLMGSGLAAGLTGAGRTLPPNLLPLLGANALPPSRHDQALQRREEKMRRQDDQNEEAAAQAAAQPSSVDQQREAERDMAPGSAAARHNQLQAKGEQNATSDRRGFRQVLEEATGRGSTERATPAAPEPVQAAGQKTLEAARTPAAEATKPGQAADATALQTAAQAARPNASPGTAPTGAESLARLMSSVASSPLGNVQPEAVDASKMSAVARGPEISAIAATPAAQSGDGSGRASGVPVAAIEGASVRDSANETTPAGSAQPEVDPESNSDANIERILRFINTRISKDRSVATLRLDPPELGTVRLRMDLRDSDLSLTIDTQTAAARRLLSEHLDTLRRSLETAGIHLDHVEIRVPATMNETRDPGVPQQPNLPPHEFGSSARRDPETAGGGSQGESDAHAAQPVEGGLTGAVTMEPAAESLVNVLA
jgi:flagellar hook-length control protein FliK